MTVLLGVLEGELFVLLGAFFFRVHNGVLLGLCRFSVVVVVEDWIGFMDNLFIAFRRTKICRLRENIHEQDQVVGNDD